MENKVLVCRFDRDYQRERYGKCEGEVMDGSWTAGHACPKHMDQIILDYFSELDTPQCCVGDCGETNREQLLERKGSVYCIKHILEEYRTHYRPGSK